MVCNFVFLLLLKFNLVNPVSIAWKTIFARFETGFSATRRACAVIVLFCNAQCLDHSETQKH